MDTSSPSKPKRVRTPKPPPKVASEAEPGVAIHETRIELRELRTPSVRKMIGRTADHPYTSIVIIDLRHGEVIATHTVHVNAPAHVALGILKTICNRNLDLTNKQLEQAKSPEGMEL